MTCGNACSQSILQHSVQSSKRRRRPESATREHPSVTNAASFQPMPSALHHAPCLPPTAEALVMT